MSNQKVMLLFLFLSFVANRQQLEIDLANEMPGGSYNTTKADDVFFNDPFF